MSKRNGAKAKVKRERKKQVLQRKRNRESRKMLESKNTEREALSPTEDENQIVSSRLRRLTEDSKADSDALEIVVYQVPSGGS